MRKTSEILDSIIDMIQQLEHLKQEVKDRDTEIEYLKDKFNDMEADKC